MQVTRTTPTDKLTTRLSYLSNGQEDAFHAVIAKHGITSIYERLVIAAVMLSYDGNESPYLMPGGVDTRSEAAAQASLIRKGVFKLVPVPGTHRHVYQLVM